MDPLVPSDCDLRDFAFLPLDVVRLRDSQLAVEASGDEFRAAILLWCAAWHQVPAASLPDHDQSLAVFAGYGRGQAGVKDWKRVREGALRGWVKCSDGRLYHPVLTEKAVEALERKSENSTNKERQKRWRERMRELCDSLRELGITPPAGASASQLETLLAEARNDHRNVTRDVTDDSERNVTRDVTEMARQGQGQGQGQGIEDQEQKLPPTAVDTDPPPASRVPSSDDRICETVVNAYHAALPRCSRVGVLNPKRQRRILLADKLARKVCMQEGWDFDRAWFWENYFAECAKDPWMAGDVPNPRNAHWRQNLEVLIDEDRFARLMDTVIAAQRRQEAA